MGSRDGIEAEEKSVIDRCLPLVYQKYFADPKPENMPVLGDLYDCLRTVSYTHLVIDFVAKYFDLSVKESAEKLAEDFSVPYEKYQSYNKTKDYQKPKQKKQTLDQFFHEQQIRFFRVYSDYFHLLKKWKVEYAPRIEDDDWHPLFVEAMEKYTLIEYKMDVLLSGSLEDRARLILDCQEEVKNIEQRIKEESSGRCGCTSGSVTES